MNQPKLTLNEQGKGAFTLVENDEQLAQMVVAISGTDLTVYHTEVAPKAEGQGLAKALLNAMVAYARAHQLKVIALCPYVHAQFKRHPKEFEDVWNKV